MTAHPTAASQGCTRLYKDTADAVIIACHCPVVFVFIGDCFASIVPVIRTDCMLQLQLLMHLMAWPRADAIAILSPIYISIDIARSRGRRARALSSYMYMLVVVRRLKLPRRRRTYTGTCASTDHSRPGRPAPRAESGSARSRFRDGSSSRIAAYRYRYRLRAHASTSNNRLASDIDCFVRWLRGGRGSKALRLGRLQAVVLLVVEQYVDAARAH